MSTRDVGCQTILGPETTDFGCQTVLPDIAVEDLKGKDPYYICVCYQQNEVVQEAKKNKFTLLIRQILQNYMSVNDLPAFLQSYGMYIVITYLQL